MDKLLVPGAKQENNLFVPFDNLLVLIPTERSTASLAFRLKCKNPMRGKQWSGFPLDKPCVQGTKQESFPLVPCDNIFIVIPKIYNVQKFTADSKKQQVISHGSEACATK